MKSNGLIKKIVGAALSALVFLGFAFPFIAAQTAVNDETKTNAGTWQEWLDTIDGFNKLESDKIGWWNASKVLYIILFVLVAIVAVALIVSIFIDNNILVAATKWVSLATLLVAIVSLITLIGGCFALSSSSTIFGVTTSFSYLPHFGSILMGLLGIVGPAVAISACSAKKAKKRK